MSILVNLSGRRPRPTSRRRSSSARGPKPGLEPLEGRALMALISSVSFDPKGQEIADVILNNPEGGPGYYDKVYTPGYVANGPTPYTLTGHNSSPGLPFPSAQPDHSTGPVVGPDLVTPPIGYRSASTAYDKAGDILQDVVDIYGHASQYISYVNGQYDNISLGSGVESMSVAFEPDGTGVSDVVYEDGSYYEFTSTGGSALIARDVVSASVAIDKSGHKLQDYVTADGILHEISASGTTTLGDQVVSSGVAFDGNGGVVRSVVFTDGMAYQYDYAGQHLQGQVFTPVTQPEIGSTSVAFSPTGEEYALIAYGDETLYQFNASGTAHLASGVEGEPAPVLSASTAFSKSGKIIQDVVTPDGDAYEYIDGDAGTFLGSGVQSVSIAFDPEGNEVADVVYRNGSYYEFDSSGGSTLISDNVVSASVAIDHFNDKVQDYVTADGVLHEITTSGLIDTGNQDVPARASETTTLGNQVVTASVAFDGNGNVVRSVLFNDGLAYQYDATGQHLQGQVFAPSLVNPSRLALLLKSPSI